MRKKFSPEFKTEAVNLVTRQGLSIAQVANDLGIGKSSLDKWVRVARERARDPNALSEAELAELKRLRKENHLLKIERDILKKTAIYFARDTGRGSNS